MSQFYSTIVNANNLLVTIERKLITFIDFINFIKYLKP